MAETKRVTGDYTIKTLGAGSQVIIDSDLVVTGDINFEDVKNRVYVAKNGDDTQDGLSWAKAKRTIKAACALAQQLIDNATYESNHVAIMVASGDYTEDCPITVPEGCAIIGDNLRSVTVRPSVATSNVFYLNSNCYAWGITVRGHRLSPSALDITPEGYAGYNGQGLPRSTKQTGFAFSFAPGAIIRVSPYIQNCSSISGSGVFGNPDYVPGGGGILVDPSVCAEGNRVNSIVLDAFTQINQGGIGCKVVGRGYMQLVSFFVNFCQFGILCVDGGHVTLLNSNCSFGNYAFWSEGQRTLVREADEELDSEDLSGLVLATASETDATNDTILCDSVADLELNMPVRFSIPASNSPAMLANIVQDRLYYIVNIDSANSKIKISETAGGTALDINATVSGGSMTIRYAHEEVRPYESARTVLGTNRATYQNDVVTAVDAYVVSNNSTTCTSINGTTEVITCGDTTKLALGMPVRFTGTLFGGVDEYTTYYVVDIINSTTFKISTTVDGNPVDLTTASGTMTVSFYYDRGKCKRDVGLIVDAIVQDLLTDSVIYSRRAGTAYWNGVTNLIEGQQEQTVYAIEQLETEILADLAGSDPAITPIKCSLDTIKDFIDNGPNRPFETARNTIETNLATYQSGLIAYVNATYPSLIYSEDKCERDVDYLTKAIISDLITGTGRASRTAGNAYYTGTVDIPLPTPALVFDEDQKNPTVDAIEWLRDEIVSDVSATYAGDCVVRYFDTITGIISNGPDPDDLLLSPTYEPARILLDLNKDFIKAETVAYVNDELSLSAKVTLTTFGTDLITVISTRLFESGTPVRFTDNIGGLTSGTQYYVLPGFTATQFQVSTSVGGSAVTLSNDVPTGTLYCLLYDQDKCQRDVGYIVDAVISDLTTNSQESTLMAGNAYWRGAASISQAFVNQIPDTLSAIDYAKRLSLKVIASDITPPIGSPELLEPRDIFFKSDGTKLYILGGVGPKVYQYSLGTAWDTSDLEFEGSYGLSDQEITPQGMYIGDSGTKLYVVGTGTVDDETDGKTVYWYDLTTAWDVTGTVTYNASYTLTNVDAPSGIAFSSTGNKMFVLDNTGSAIYSYNLGTNWEVDTASIDTGNEYSITDDNLPTGMYLNSAGTDLYVAGTTNDVVIHYELTTPYDLTSIVLIETVSITNQETEITGLHFKSDGSKLYITGLNSDSVIKYDLLTNWDISSLEFVDSTPVGYFSTPYQNTETQQFVATVTATNGTTDVLTCDTTFYLKAGDPVKFVPTSSGSVFGGVVEGTIYYVREILSTTTFTISATSGGSLYTGITTVGSGSMAVAPSAANSVGAGYEVEKFFNTIIDIIRNGAREKEEEFGSLVEATGYTLSYAGAGIDYTKLSPGQGGTGLADPNKYTIELSGGRVFITATDEQGDFYVGKITPSAAGENARPLFRINQASGAIDGRAFYQSIFGFLAPFILALTRRK